MHVSTVDPDTFKACFNCGSAASDKRGLSFTFQPCQMIVDGIGTIRFTDIPFNRFMQAVVSLCKSQEEFTMVAYRMMALFDVIPDIPAPHVRNGLHGPEIRNYVLETAAVFPLTSNKLRFNKVGFRAELERRLV